MPRDVFEFSCPCCGKRVELNTRNGKVRAVRVEESKRGKNFDDMVADQKHEGDRLGSIFDEAKQDDSAREERLEDLFGEAKQEAEKDKDKKPRHPFEHDGR